MTVFGYIIGCIATAICGYIVGCNHGYTCGVDDEKFKQLLDDNFNSRTQQS